MNNQVRFYLRRFTLWYYNFRYSKYHSVVISAGVIAISLAILVIFILPQLMNWLSVENEIQATQKRINIMRQNNITLSNLNKFNVGRDFSTVVQALPPEKDFISILNAIGKAGIDSNISLNDYEFSVGAVSIGRDTEELDTSLAPVNIGLEIEGDIDSISKFIFEIENKLPLAEVKNFNYSEGSGKIIIAFHMMPFSKKELNYSDPIFSLNQEQRNILQTLYQWTDK